MTKHIRSFWFVLFWLFAVQADTQELRFNYLNQTDGLPSDWVFAIEQDKHGFMWVGTDAGLARFDGYEVHLHRAQHSTEDSLLSNKIRSLFTDTQGRLWVGSADGGVNRFNTQTQSFDVVDLAGVVTATVRSFAQVESTLIIGTSKGLYLLTEGEHSAKLATVTAEYSINAIAVDHYGGIWLGTGNGIYRYDLERFGDLQRIPVNHPGRQRVLALSVDQSNTLWASIDKKLYAKSAGSTAMTQQLEQRLPDAFITSLQPLSTGQLAIGTFEGLYLYDVLADSIARFTPSETLDASLSDHQVFALEQDRTGSLWIGTYRGGVSYANPDTQALGLNRLQGECRLKGIKGVELANDGIWLAKAGEVMQLLDDQTCRRFPLMLEDSLSPTALGIHRDTRGTLWVRLEQQGLARLDVDTGNLVPVSDEILDGRTVSSLVETDDGHLWLGTENHGLIEFNQADNTLTQVESTGELSIYEIDLWREGLLLATNRGVLHYQPASGSISEPFTLPSRVEVLSLSVDEPRQSVWVGTRSDGLFLARLPSGPVVRIDEKTGFLGETVRVVVTDASGASWVGSNRGIYRTPPGQLVFRGLRVRDGLHGDTQYSGDYSSQHNKVVFAGEKGLNLIAVSDVPLNRRTSEVVVTRFALAGQEDSPFVLGATDAESLTLRHSSKDFRFHFSLPHYDDVTRNRFRYQLEGYDSQWNTVGADNRHASYTNLPAGNYQLKIMGANKDNVWGPESVGFALTIQPAWWATWWSRLCLIGLALVLLWGYTRYRNRQALQHAQQLGELVERRTEEIATQKNTIEALLRQKNDLFAAISHEFRTPLTLIEGPLQHIASSLPDGTSNKHVHIIQYSSQRLLKLVDQLLSLAGLDRATEPELVTVRLDLTLTALVAAFTPSAVRKEIHIRYAPPSKAILVEAQPDAVETIVGNLINNALKFCPLGSQIEIDVTETINSVELSVSDNGPGIPQDERNHVFGRFYRASNAANEPGAGLGLALCRELAAASGGLLQLDPDYRSGARFRLHLNRAQTSAVTVPLVESDAFLLTQGLLGVDPDSVSYKVPSSTDAPDASKHSVLIIDDDPQLRAYIAEELHEYSCMTASDGQIGIKLALETVPDLIVCDVMMPGADGFEVAKTIRGDVRTSHIPFVLLTARVDNESRIRGWQEHVDEYLTKPFTATELNTRLRSILEVRRLVQRRFSRHLMSSDATVESLDASLLPKADAMFMQRLTKSVEQQYKDPTFGPDVIASDCAMSVRQLQRKLRALIDVTPADYLRDYRLKAAARLLVDGIPAGRVAEDCGFSSASQFSRCFRANFDVSPSAYQQSEKQRKLRTFKQSR